MPNPIKGEVAFTSGGQSYTIIYDFNALVVLEDRFDKSVDAIIVEIGRDRRLKKLAAALRPGLLHQHPEMTEAQAGELMMNIDGDNSPFDLILDGITAAFPKRATSGEGEGADSPPARAPAESPAADGITSISSASGASSVSDPPLTTGD